VQIHENGWPISNRLINCTATKTFILIGRVLVMLTKAALESADQSRSPSWSHGTTLARRQIIDSRGTLAKRDGIGRTLDQ